jgi:hypothetical protein
VPATTTTTGIREGPAAANHSCLVNCPKDERLQQQLRNAVTQLQGREGRARNQQAPLNPTLLGHHFFSS